MSVPKVSVIIPTYNYSHYLREAIDSVLGQTVDGVEVIVVDDGSTDDSKDVLKSYGDRIKPIFQQNKGVSAARNHGVSVSSGEYLAFLDADDVWLPKKTERQLTKFETEGCLGLVHTGVVDIDGHGNELKEHNDGRAGRVSEDLLCFDGPVILGGGSGVMVPRRVFDEVGGFDTQLSTSADWDFFYQVCSRYEAGYVSEVLLKYRMHSSNMHGNIGAMEHDMLIGFEKAFSNGDVLERGRCYGNLYRMLAGSYFRSGKYSDFVRNAVLSIRSRPANLGYFLQFPLRRLQAR